MTTTAVPTRVQVGETFPAAYSDVLRLAGSTRKAAADAGLDPGIVDLVKVRSSQLNGCSFCLDMHTGEALAHGVPARKLHVLAAWRETELFTPVERIALELAETLTRLTETRDVPDELYDRALRILEPEQYAAIVYNIAMINVFNRIAVASHKPLPPSAAG